MLVEGNKIAAVVSFCGQLHERFDYTLAPPRRLPIRGKVGERLNGAGFIAFAVRNRPQRRWRN